MNLVCDSKSAEYAPKGFVWGKYIRTYVLSQVCDSWLAPLSKAGERALRVASRPNAGYNPPSLRPTTYEREFMTIKIVTDTGSDIPPDWLAAYDIHLVPLVLRFGDREVEDNETTRAELWQRVEAGLPCETSGPPVGAYVAAFAPLVEAGNQVLCITLPAAHSVTYNSAWVAAQTYPGDVEVVDGRSLSLGYGLQAIEAASDWQPPAWT